MRRTTKSAIAIATSAAFIWGGLTQASATAATPDGEQLLASASAAADPNKAFAALSEHEQKIIVATHPDFTVEDVKTTDTLTSPDEAATAGCGDPGFVGPCARKCWQSHAEGKVTWNPPGPIRKDIGKVWQTTYWCMDHVIRKPAGIKDVGVYINWLNTKHESTQTRTRNLQSEYRGMAVYTFRTDYAGIHMGSHTCLRVIGKYWGGNADRSCDL